ncbi:BRO family protein [Symbiobacterium terraclitae]|uniref:BRO family protein n=1 Tax=Symbiobacterium terraclitae TaxID=557451 RepID=UPI0035B51FA0
MNELAVTGRSVFDVIRRTDEQGQEYWSARDLQPLLGYERWERFADAIDRAMVSCTANGHAVSDHFRRAGKMVPIGSGAEREVTDYHLSRFGCYLVAMNGDPRKREIAAAQAYFAIKTRQQELAEQQAPTQAQLALVMAKALVELEQQMHAVTARVEAIEARQRDAEQQLQALPAPSGPVADVSTRALLNRLIRAYSVETGIPHNSLWRQLYREFRDRYHVDLVARATGSKKPIDVAEEIGHIQTLYNLAATLFKRAS